MSRCCRCSKTAAHACDYVGAGGACNREMCAEHSVPEFEGCDGADAYTLCPEHAWAQKKSGAPTEEWVTRTSAGRRRVLRDYLGASAHVLGVMALWLGFWAYVVAPLVVYHTPELQQIHERITHWSQSAAIDGLKLAALFLALFGVASCRRNRSVE